MKGIKIAKIFGIDIELHWSWFLVFLFFSYVLAGSYFPKKIPNQSSWFYYVLGAITVIMLFFSVVVHELSHSRVAQHFKIPIEKITLLFFGGAARLKERTKSAKEEFLMAIAGPLSSAVLAGIFWGLAHFLKTDIKWITVLLVYLVFINLALAIFNLLPAYPMDGGRIFVKSIIWAISKDELKATKWASLIGQFCGIAMLVLGAWRFGLMFMVIGFFLFLMAPVEYRQLIVEKVLAQGKVHKVQDLVITILARGVSENESCSPRDNLANVLMKMDKYGHFYLYVVEDSQIIGIVTKSEIEAYIQSKLK